VNSGYDMIIVGAGTSGCALAARLSEDPQRSVLLLEAGPRFRGVDGFPPELRYSGVFSSMALDHPNNWGFTATLRPGIQQPLPRGRVVGGSSAVNGTLFTRGLPEDFDGWAAEGNKEWSYDRVLPFFVRLEADYDVQDEHHGNSGPIPVRRADPAEWSPITKAFVAACRGAGFPDDSDVNGPKSIGVGALPVNSVNGVRFNTALAYLDPIDQRRNLTVRAECIAQRIIFEHGKAVGVEVRSGANSETIHGGEIVLSAGAVKSPHLLMLSGVGPADELTRWGIRVFQDSPYVGREFTDHCTMHIGVRVSQRRNPAPDPTKHSLAEAGLHYTSSVGDHSDMMLFQTILPLNTSMLYGVGLLGRLKIVKSAMKEMSARQLMEQARVGSGMGMSCIIMKGSSRGELRLLSRDPMVNPELLYHYFEQPDDLARMREGFRLAAQLVRSGPYLELGARLLGPDRKTLESDRELDEFLCRYVGTSIHMSSTCRMGPSIESSVVDQYCRVHGLENLRIVDTSVMPRVVRRCPAATAVMIGERASEFFG
jgi:choline dehydrogenase